MICHGFRGYKDWSFIPFLARRLNQDGIPAIAFNFTGSGITDRKGRFGEPERFQRSTYGRELADLARVADWAAERLDGGGELHLGLIGHSRGGAIALLHAPTDPRVRCIVTLASPARIGVWPERYFEAWRRGEPAQIHDFRTKSELLLGPDLIRDFESHRDRYDVPRAVERLTTPLLIIQGDRDRSVPLDEARELAAHAPSASSELRIIGGAGHSFQAGDEIRRTPPQLLDTIELAAAWMRRWLR